MPHGREQIRPAREGKSASRRKAVRAKRRASQGEVRDLSKSRRQRQEVISDRQKRIRVKRVRFFLERRAGPFFGASSGSVFWCVKRTPRKRIRRFGRRLFRNVLRGAVTAAAFGRHRITVLSCGAARKTLKYAPSSVSTLDFCMDPYYN